ncbi:DEAD/DEAH box helicase [Aquimarina megaterium]|uniref:DEAD/DEAH box helicase n=1 Tax=Aquimarina megaterium TaxID=1443666 RepID=UPI000942D45D|nr:DEAD/DEAH box helicase family protein [Aquimarina megaterium]
MIDFNKRINKLKEEKQSNPLEIYENLDRSSDKGPLRPAQKSILQEWFTHRSYEKDTIIKLHTGRGKTLIGFLILQSKLNQNSKPCLYVCPNKFLAEQTCLQAKQFGIKYCTIGEDKNLPQEFLDGESILISHAQKMFNGFTKFGLGTRAVKLGAIILDDSHSCIDTIEDSFTITLKSNQETYKEIFKILEHPLEDQGFARLQEIRGGNGDDILGVPYWIWHEKYHQITEILAKNKNNEDEDYKFAWNLIKDQIENCHCILSASKIEIRPYLNPIENYGSFHTADTRIFMSATTNNDSFFIKGLGLSAETVCNPLLYSKEVWSGEKMILLPYNIDNYLSRNGIVKHFASPDTQRKYGIVILTSSFKKSKLWEEHGAISLESSTISEKIKDLRSGNYERALIIANRYDGIDLPDNSCRILIIDSKPHFDNLFDRYQEEVRKESDMIDIKIAQKIEQGFGRGVRGEKDYCVILLTGKDMHQIILDPRYRKFFSKQTQEQVKIGKDVTRFATEDADSKDSLKTLKDVINTCLSRDDGWKEYYKQRMDDIEHIKKENKILSILEKEKFAEEAYRNLEYDKAKDITQKIIDDYIEPGNDTEKGWYIQEMGRFIHLISPENANKFQIEAHKKNKNLFKPSSGMIVTKLTIRQDRIEKIKNWIGKHGGFSEMQITLEGILSNLSFGVKADLFEQALEETGKLLGFESERPEKYWKIGPDNLWCISNGKYILFECKNDVSENRKEIYKKETGQMSNSCDWFDKKYHKCIVKPAMIINTRKLAQDASMDPRVEILKKNNLRSLKNNIKGFFKEFASYDLDAISSEQIQSLLNSHKLTGEYIFGDVYFEKVIDARDVKFFS